MRIRWNSFFVTLLFGALLAGVAPQIHPPAAEAQSGSTATLSSPIIYNPTIIGGSISSLTTPLSSANIASSIIQTATFNLSSANILAMNGAPVTILAAQGASTTIIVDQIALAMTTTSTQYASGGVVSFQYHGASTNLMSTTIAAGVITAGAGTSLTALGEANSQTGVSNVGIDITNATGAFTTGTGTGILYIRYRVLPF